MYARENDVVRKLKTKQENKLDFVPPGSTNKSVFFFILETPPRPNQGAFLADGRSCGEEDK